MTKELSICLLIVTLLIGGSIGVGYGINKFKERDLIKNKVIEPENLILKCKKTGRNYDCNPILENEPEK